MFKVTTSRNLKYQFKSYHWEKLTFSKLWFSKFKKFASRAVFEELQFTRIPLNFKTSCCNLKMGGLAAKKSIWVFYYFDFDRSYRKSRPEVLCKKRCFRNFEKFTRKHLCQSLFFNNVAGPRSAILLKKETLAQVFSCEYCKIPKNTFFKEHLGTTASGVMTH